MKYTKKQLKEHDVFWGRRYSDYDNLDMKKFILKHNKKLICRKCKKEIKKIENAYYGFLNLYCKNCYIEVCIQASEEVNRFFPEHL